MFISSFYKTLFYHASAQYIYKIFTKAQRFIRLHFFKSFWCIMFRDQSETKSAVSQQQTFFSIPPLTLDKMLIVFDIDDTLQSPVQRGHEEQPESYLRLVKEKFPEQIISYEYKKVIYDQILSPGVLETFQYLLGSGCHIALFSASEIEDRNQRFKTELLKRALSGEDFEKYKDQVLVFSEKHLTRCEDSSDLVSNIYGTRGPTHKKDLNVVIRAFAELGIKFSLDQVILVDNELPWMAQGQAKNFLKIPGCYDCDILNFRRTNNINHMFYVVGLINLLLKTGTPLSTLFHLQFIDDKNSYNAGFKTYDFDLPHQSQYYDVGLNILRSVNKDLRLIDEAYILQELKDKRKKL